MGYRTEEIMEPRQIAIPTCDRCGRDLPERDGIGYERDAYVLRVSPVIAFVRGSDDGDKLELRDERGEPRAVYCLPCAESSLQALGVQAHLRSPKERFAGRKICVFSRRDPEGLAAKYGAETAFSDAARLRGTQFEVVVVDDSATAEDFVAARLAARLGDDPIIFFDATGLWETTARWTIRR